MIALIRAELLQLRTLRSTWVAAVGLVALVTVVAVASAQEAGTTPDELRSTVIAGAGVLSAIFFALLGALRVGGEYRHATIAQRVLSEPRRIRVVAAKLVTYAGVAGAASALAFALAAALALAVGDVSMTVGEALAATSHVVLAGALFAVLGVAVGFVARSQPAAVVVVFGTFFAEKILASVLGDVASVLPFGLLDSLLNDDGALSPALSALVLSAIAAAVAAVAVTAFSRRDVPA